MTRLTVFLETPARRAMSLMVGRRRGPSPVPCSSLPRSSPPAAPRFGIPTLPDVPSRFIALPAPRGIGRKHDTGYSVSMSPVSSVLTIDPRDDVAVALAPLAAGDPVAPGITTTSDIPPGHKVALRAIAKGDP